MENKKLEDKKYYFEKLTPINRVDLGIYKNAFDFVFKDSDIKNVAVSGAYSSGKSSVLESYKSIHKEKNFLHISLAYFQAIEEEKDIEELVLEGKILNQLMHQIPEKKIQQTNFKIKRKKSNCWFYIQSLIAWLFIMSILYFLFFKSFMEYSFDLSNIGFIKLLAQLLSAPITSYVFGAAFAFILFYYVYAIIKVQKNKNVFCKVNVQGNEIEIFEEDEDSYFDKYLNEVLYLFENADADVIVFEDMDRFNTNRIFERLREFNTLVNLRREKEKVKEPLRFFYLLRDDVFLSKDRTKFFDFIIPVVPVIDGSNSYDQIMDIFNKNEILEELFNEKINAKEAEIKLIKEEILESVKELEDAYNGKKEKDYWGNYKQLSDENKKQYAMRRQAIEDRENNRLKDKEKELNELKNQLLKLDTQSLNEIITRENIDKIFSTTSKNDINEEILYNDVKGNNYFCLLKYLIRNGYIDESYSNYMTYFYENSISRIDKNFLLGITNKNAMEYNYRLENLDKVVSRLDESDFDQPESLNFDLFRYLLKNEPDDDCKKYLFRCIKQIKDTKNFKFIGEFFNIASKELSVYVQTLNQQWPGIFIQALDEDGLSTEQLKAYSVASIYNSSDDVIKAMDVEGKLGEYISNLPDYLAIEEPDIDKLIDGFKQLEVLFTEINHEVSNKKLFQKVYQNSLYALNTKNIELILEKIYGINSKKIF